MASVLPTRFISTSDEIPIEIHGWLRIHKDGRCERLVGTDTLPAGTDPSTGVRSKDVVISSEPYISARLYIPKTASVNRKLPTLIYIHGGGFVTESAFSSTYHPMLNLITSESNVIAVSVNYRLAPEHLIPIPYDDSWEAIKWVAAHRNGNGPDPWLNGYADLSNVFFCGDSAGANIAHEMAIRVGRVKSGQDKVVSLTGLILMHPFFGGKDPIGSENSKNKVNKAFVDYFWFLANRPGVGLDDPLWDPSVNPNLSGLGCSKILVCVGERDRLKERGLYYKEVVEKSGWKGKVEVFESKKVGHVFFLFDNSCKEACTLRKNICTFINSVCSKI